MPFVKGNARTGTHQELQSLYCTLFIVWHMVQHESTLFEAERLRSGRMLTAQVEPPINGGIKTRTEPSAEAALMQDWKL